MGFRAPRPPIGKVALDGDLAGLEVISTRAERRMLRIASYLGSLSEGAKFTPSDLALLDQVFIGFAESLITWNLEDWRTGEPVPTTLEGVMGQDTLFMLDVISRWLLTAPTEPDAAEIEAIEAALEVKPLVPDDETDDRPEDVEGGDDQ